MNNTKQNEMLEALNQYAVTYLNGQEYKENKQALYSIEQGDDIRFFKAPNGYTADDILKIAREDKSYAKLIELGERIYDGGNYAAIQQSDEFTFSVEMNFDTDTAKIYKVNDGKGGIDENDRTSDNIRLYQIKISEYVQDKTFAYEIGNSAPFIVVHLDIGTEERKNAVSEALKNIIYNAFGERNDMSQPYKNLLEQITPTAEFIHAFEGHLSCLKYALRNAESYKELCVSMLDSIKSAENNPEKTVIIKGYDCLPKDAWEEDGIKFTIGQSVDRDMSFYYARATDGKVTRDYEYDHKPDREKVMSDHADKLAEEDIDRGEAIYGADGYAAFPDPESKHLVDNIAKAKTNNPYNEKNFRIQPTDNDTYVVKSDSKRFGDNAIVFESSKRDECVTYISQRQLSLDWKPYVIKDLRSWADPSAVQERSQIEYFDTIEDALKRFNDLRNMPYNAEKALNSQTGEPMARLTLGMSSSNLAVDILHVRDNKNYLVQDFALMPKMNTDRNFLDSLAKVGAEVGFERVIAHQRDENTGTYIGEPKDLPLNEWKNPYFKEETNYQKIENIPQKLGISHNFINADPTAKRGERKNTMSTKFEVSSITKLDGENGTKALASVAVNDEFIVSGISVRESREGNLYVQMPQQKNGVDEQGKDKYEDRVFPVLPDARKALDNAVLGAYENLNEKGLNNSYVNIEPPEKSASKLTVSLKKFNSEKSVVKAKGQITVDNCLVIKGVSVSQHTNSQTNEKFDKVNLPQFKQNSKGEYPLVVKPITAEFRKKLDNAVLGAFYSQTRGVNFSDLGGKDNTASFFRQNNEFAEKIMNELDNKGIPYHAKIDTLKKTTTISFKASDKAAVEEIKKSINEDEKKPSALGEISKIKKEKTQTEKAAPAKQQEKTQQKSNNNQEL